MGNGEFQLPGSIREEWHDFSAQGRQYTKNVITHQVFQFMILSTCGASKSVSQFIERSIYPFPKTPKIIVLYDQMDELFLLVQQQDSTLARELPNICVFIDLLEIIKNIALVLQSLHRKYGAFRITEAMLGVNRNYEVLVWINESKQKNEVQFPLENTDQAQYKMLQSLMKVIRKYTHFSACLDFLKKQYNFSAFLTSITEFINAKKTEFVRTEGERPKTRPKRVLTPQYPYELPMNFNGKLQNINSTSHLRKRPSIPNFIKCIKEKKINLLDSISYKRTLTKQDADASKNVKNKTAKKKQISDYTSEFSHVRSLKPSLLKGKECNNSYSNLSKLSKQVSNTQTSEQLTSSGDSINQIIKKRDFTEKSRNKSKIQTPYFSSTGQISKKIQQTASQYTNEGQSLIIKRSPQKMNLVSLCTNITQSKYFQTHRVEKSIIKESEEQNQQLSKMLQDQLNGFFGSSCPSPRNNPIFLQETVQNADLREQFKRIINF